MFSITKEEVSSLMDIADKNGDGSVAQISFLVLNYWDCSGLLPEMSFLGDKKTHKQKGELTWLLISWTGWQNYKVTVVPMLSLAIMMAS
jgi:hypothetical protein